MENNVQKNLMKAKFEFQKKWQVIAKGSSVSFGTGNGGKVGYKYADLTDTLSIILPILNDCGLLLETFAAYLNVYNDKSSDTVGEISQLTEKGLIKVIRGVKIVLTHVESGESQKNFEWFDKSTVDIKELGAQRTYLRRYGILTILNLASDDPDDMPPNPPPNGPDLNSKQIQEISDSFAAYKFTDADIKIMRDAKIMTKSMMVKERKKYENLTNAEFIEEIKSRTTK